MRHRRMMAPIVSVKHYVPHTNALIAAAGLRNNILALAVAVGDAHDQVEDVTEGSIIKAVHLDMWAINGGTTGTSTQFTAILEKVPAGQTPATAAQLLNLQSYPNKKNVLHSFQGNLSAGVDGSMSTPYLRGWFKIPKGKQRMGLGDQIVVSLTPVTQACEICGMAVYKEYQ